MNLLVMDHPTATLLRKQHLGEITSVKTLGNMYMLRLAIKNHAEKLPECATKNALWVLWCPTQARTRDLESCIYFLNLRTVQLATG